MSTKRHPSLTRLPRRNAIVLLSLLVLSVGLIVVLPSNTPVALAGRLFQSPVETPTVPPTTPPEQPTTTPLPPEQPTVTSVPPTVPPAQPSPTASFVNGAGEAVTPLPPTTMEQQPAEAPIVSEEPEDAGFDWVKFIDTTILVFSWFWLACGIVVVIVVTVLIIALFVKSRRLHQP